MMSARCLQCNILIPDGRKFCSVQHRCLYYGGARSTSKQQLTRNKISDGLRSSWSNGARKKYIRLCDNLDCWNILQVHPYQTKNRKRHFCSNECKYAWFKDNVPSKRKDVAEKISKDRKRAVKISIGVKQWRDTHHDLISGRNHWNWQGGPKDPYCEKWTPELRERIRAFFDYECIICGKTQKDNLYTLCCHHVEGNKQACCDDEPARFASLCQKCHGMVGAKKDKQRWMSMLRIIIYEIYNDRSYFTKEEWEEICR